MGPRESGTPPVVRNWPACQGRIARCERSLSHRTVVTLPLAEVTVRCVCGSLPAGQEPTSLRGHGSDVTGLAFTIDGRFLVSCSSDKTVRLWDFTEGRELACYRRHEHSVRSVAFSPDGSRLASAGADGTVRLGDTHGAQETGRLRGHVGEVTSLAFSLDGRMSVFRGC